MLNKSKHIMNMSDGASIMESYPNLRNGIVKLDFQYILLVRKQGSRTTATATALTVKNLKAV